MAAAQGGDQFAALIVDRAAPAEVVVVLRHLQHALARHVAAAQDVLEERDHVCRTFRTAEGHDQNGIVVHANVGCQRRSARLVKIHAAHAGIAAPAARAGGHLGALGAAVGVGGEGGVLLLQVLLTAGGAFQRSASAERRTSFSNLVPQSSQLYS